MVRLIYSEVKIKYLILKIVGTTLMVISGSCLILAGC